MFRENSKHVKGATIVVAALVLLLVAAIQSTVQAAPLNQASNSCVIPESGPWPPCATGGNSTGQAGDSSSSCVIPASGPWPACATGGNTNSGSNSGGDCVIPPSGRGPTAPEATQCRPHRHLLQASSARHRLA